MRILLIGHRGYIGARLQTFLEEQGHAVIGFGSDQDITTLTPFILEQQQVELVINCAASVMDRSKPTFAVEGADELINVWGVRQLVQALAGTEIGLIHFSTKEVYGDVYTTDQLTETGKRLVPAFAINESQPYRPRSVYGKTKLMGEFIAEAHPKTNIIRLSSGYTSQPHHRGNWIQHFCRASKNGQPVRLGGSGKQLRDPVHADDLGRLFLLLHEKNVWGHKINAGGGKAHAVSVLEVLDMIDAGLPREFSPGGDLGYVSDITLAKNLVGWEPTVSFEAQLRALMDRVRDE